MKFGNFRKSKNRFHRPEIVPGTSSATVYILKYNDSTTAEVTEKFEVRSRDFITTKDILPGI